MAIKESIVKRFEEICEERQIRPNELATMSGVTPSTVYSMLSSSRKDMSVTTLKKLCDGLDMSMKEFFDTDYFEELEPEIK